MVNYENSAFDRKMKRIHAAFKKETTVQEYKDSLDMSKMTYRKKKNALDRKIIEILINAKEKNIGITLDEMAALLKVKKTCSNHDIFFPMDIVSLV